MADLQRYVAGFAFNPQGTVVLLVQKRKPAWQAGRFNGIGGKIENGESPVQAMVREFAEEAGLHTRTEMWRRFCVLHGHYTVPGKHEAGSEQEGFVSVANFEEYEVHFFCTYLPDSTLATARSNESEQIVRLASEQVTSANSIPNLPWLVAMARNMDMDLHRAVEEYSVHEQYAAAASANR